MKPKEVLGRIHSSFNESHTVVKKREVSGVVLKDASATVKGEVKIPPANPGMIPFPFELLPGPTTVETFTVVDQPGQTSVQVIPYKDIIYLGREHERDKYRINRKIKVVNEYPFRRTRRLVKWLTGWQAKS